MAQSTHIGEANALFAKARQTVLFVDDEKDVRDAFKSFLELSIPGVRVVTAESGQPGLDLLQREAVDMILADYKMPGMNGLDFLVNCQKLYPVVPRIMVTAYPDMDVVIRAINEGHLDGFLTKPVDQETLLELVTGYLYELRAKELRQRAFARSLKMLREAQGAVAAGGRVDQKV